MKPEHDRIGDLLGPVSDGEAIDWDAVVRGADPAERALAEALRDVDRIGAYSRGLQRQGAMNDGATESFRDVPRWGELVLLEKRGAGSSAEVWRAWDPRLRREVALKLVLPGLPGEHAPAGESPLLAEGRALARVRHPHVVAVHGIDERDGRVGLWMDLVRGETLEQAVAAGGPLSAAEAARLGREIGAAVAAVHEAGLLHRDIKPANVVRDTDGRWMLADFGLGRARPDTAAGAGALPGLVGSPMYMAPELLAAGAPDTGTDVYALGLLVWYALAGAHPFPEGSLGELRRSVEAGPQPSLARRRPGLPAPLVAAVERAIAPSASRRFATAAQFVAALPAGAPAGGPRRRRAWLVGAAVAMAVLLPVAALVMSRAGSPAKPAAADAWEVEATLLRHAGGAPSPLAAGDAVAPGDRLSLRWRASRDLWVYVLNADDRGEAYLLFPQPRYAARNPLPAGAEVDLPGRIDGGEFAWTVTSAGGRETFLVVASPEPMPELEAGLADLAAPVPVAAVSRLRGVGGLSALPPGEAAPAGAGGSALARFRSLAGRESGVTGVWVREIVLRNPG